jgi:hypothetical protein
MTQPVSGGWSGFSSSGVDDPHAPVATPARGGPPPQPGGASGTSPSTAASVAAARTAAAAAQRDGNVQAALQAFFARATTLTVSVRGNPVTVSVPFRMVHAGEVPPPPVDAGRGTLAQIQERMQSLLQSAKFNSNLPGDSVTLRALMFELNVGLDCAGYVRQAAIAAGVMSDDGRGAFDDLNPESMKRHGFALVPSYEQARPGDIFVLAGRPDGTGIGHRAIVYSSHVATADEVPADIAAKLGSPAGAVHIIEVDSSWGAYRQAARGGVRRETWWYGSSTGQWAWQSSVPGQPGLAVGVGPYGHYVGTQGYGLYRAPRAAR